ncbi:MAG: hypothetical protein IT165_31485 [Bryobacterales bacterium]|nr:hypothetical protein [Bryobacterales bacterium]
MHRTKRSVSLPGILLVAILIIPTVVSGHSLNPPLGTTGAPGEPTCSQCHITQPNSRAGKLSVQFSTLLTYSPGVKQTITVTITPALLSYPAAGFEATARLSNNLTAGTLEAGASYTAAGVQNGLEYISQNALSPTRTYTFYWTPPAAGAGNVTFYFAAVAGPRDGLANAIDEVYTASYTLTPKVSTAPSGYQWTFPDTGSTGRSAATGISTDGRLTGYNVGIDTSSGFLRNPDGALIPINVPGAVSTTPYGVNSSGVVAGAYLTSDGRSHGFMRSATGAYSAFDVPGSNTAINGISDNGEMVATVTGATARGVRLSSSLQIIENLPLPPLGINSSGVFSAAGPAPAPTDSTPYGYLYAQNSYVSFPACTGTQAALTALGLNDSADAAGSCFSVTTAAVNSAFLRLGDGRTTTLGSDNSGVPGPFAANGINNAGQIAATGFPTIGATPKAMLLTPCPATVAQTSITDSGSGGSYPVTASSAGDCHLLAFSDASWISISQGGAGNVTFTLALSPNNTGIQRTATVAVAGTNVTVTQAGLPCTVTLSSSSTLAGAQGGIATLGVASPTGCTWSATSTVSWITFPSGNTGGAAATLSYQAAPNPGVTLRTGYILIGGQVFTVNQSPGISCAYYVSTASTTYSYTGATGTAAVTTGDGCGWTSSTTTSWITIDTSYHTGSGSVVFVLAANSTGADRYGIITVAGTSYGIVQSGTSVFPSALQFVPVTPCRIADTRSGYGFTGAFGPPRLAGQSTRDFPVPSSSCSIPTNALAYSLNITAVPAGYLGYLSAWPTGETRPLVSTLNSWNGRVVANAAIVPAGTSGAISFYAANDTDLVLDINGYFVPAGTAQALAFYPVTPCRVADTRASGGKTGDYGPPSLAAGGTRSFSIPNSGCGIPSYAQAFSLNVTAVPFVSLAYLTTWPTGQSRPLASTLNSFDGQVVPNASLVPAGTNGAVSVFATDNTDVVIDVNGYFAPPGGSGALNFYTVSPCRVADTRPDSGKIGNFGAPQLAAQSTRVIPVPQSGCGVPASAQAYSLNLTAVPTGYLGYVTAWPTGMTQPLVSTLNSWNGQVVANAALVPAGNDRAVSFYVSNPTDLVLDINGYFAP